MWRCKKALEWNPTYDKIACRGFWVPTLPWLYIMLNRKFF